jgi:hypothetical protein
MAVRTSELLTGGSSPPVGMTYVVAGVEETKDEVLEFCGRKGQAVEVRRDSSGSFDCVWL